MFKSIAFVTALTSVVLAQNSYVPSGISDSCTKFFTTFNEDATFSSCTSTLTTATANPSSSSLTSALDKICSSSGCDETAIRTKLTEFYAACTPELTSSPNKQVVLMYDEMYTLIPFKTALCSKNDDGSYCTLKTPKVSSSSGQSVDGVQQALADQTPLSTSSASTLGSANLLFLFLQPTLPSTDLCVSCTRNVISAFIQWESSINYAPGLSASILLAGQSKLYKGVQDTCGPTFLSGSVQAAGGLSGGILGGKKNSGVLSAGAQGIVTSALGASAIAFLSFF